MMYNVAINALGSIIFIFMLLVPLVSIMVAAFNERNKK